MAGAMMSAQAQSGSGAGASAQGGAVSATEAEIRELREQLKVQQEEIDALKAELRGRVGVPAAAAGEGPGAVASPAAAAAAGPPSRSAVRTVAHAAEPNPVANSIAVARAPVAKPEEGIAFKGVRLIPGGYVAAETATRTRALNASINTPFNATPYMNSGDAHVTEFEGTGRQSRLSLLAETDVPFGRVSGFYEMDLLGVGANSNNNQSNSYVLRQRQAWGRLERQNGFALTAGQMWSLVTETQLGLSVGTENSPHTIDSQYHVGFSWARQYGVRVTQRMGHAELGLAVEEPAIVNFTSAAVPPNFFVGGVGAGGGAYNPGSVYSTNAAPDVVVKVAADKGGLHLEAGGIVRFFRSRIYPNQTTNAGSTAQTGAYNSTVVGGGAFASVRIPVGHGFDIGLHAMGGDGVNRYGTSQLADATVHANGVLEPLRGGHGMVSLIARPARKLELFGYAGTEYAQRTFYDVAGTIYGYAPPSLSVSGCFAEQGTTSATGTAPNDPSASCGAQTRDLAQGTAGFTWRFFDSAEKGRFQYSMQYSYLTKTAWAGLMSGTYGASGAIYAAPHATNNMVFTSFRYYIP